MTNVIRKYFKIRINKNYSLYISKTVLRINKFRLINNTNIKITE